MTKFTPDTVSANEDAINSCLQSGGDCCLELLGESPEEKEYLRQIEQVYFECGATNFRQAHFFLTIQARLQELEGSALSSDPFDHVPDSLIVRTEQLERFS